MPPLSKIILFAICLSSTSLSAAYALRPVTESTENELAAIQQRHYFLQPVLTSLLQHFSEPVHEGLTAKMYDKCEAGLTIRECGNGFWNHVPAPVIAGLRWNDNPKFRLGSGSTFCPGARSLRPVYVDMDSEPLCWSVLFYAAKKQAREGKRFDGAKKNGPYALIYRIHFGDLQFIHAMGSWDGELAADTRNKLLAWAELTYKIASGEAQDLSSPVIGISPELTKTFEANGFSPRSLWRPAKTTWVSDDDDYLRKMALGSLLHTIEDSFSTAHTDRSDTVASEQCTGLDLERMPGAIKQFYAYNRQDSKKHGERDSPEFAQQQYMDIKKVTAVSIGAEVLKSLSTNRHWEEVRPLFQCVFATARDAAPAAPGKDFE